jgi:hypothetical protein
LNQDNTSALHAGGFLRVTGKGPPNHSFHGRLQLGNVNIGLSHDANRAGWLHPISSAIFELSLSFSAAMTTKLFF